MRFGAPVRQRGAVAGAALWQVPWNQLPARALTAQRGVLSNARSVLLPSRSLACTHGHEDEKSRGLSLHMLEQLLALCTSGAALYWLVIVSDISIAAAYF